jgi:hypothetical protein
MIPSTERLPNVAAIHFGENQLARVLYVVYYQLFGCEEFLDTHGFQVYHYASFVSFLRLVQTRIKCVWDLAMHYLTQSIEERCHAITRGHHLQELYLYLHVMGVFTSQVIRTEMERGNVQRSPISHEPCVDERWGGLRDWDNIPPIICVTLKIPRKELAVFTQIRHSESRTPNVHCSLQILPSSGEVDSWCHIFAACQLVFGDISARGKLYDNSREVFVTEDGAGWNGTSPLIAVFYAPASLLLSQSHRIAVTFGIHRTPANVKRFGPKLGSELNIYETSLDNSAAVYITRYGPNQPGFSIVTGFAQTTPTNPINTGAGATGILIAGVDMEAGHIATFAGRLYITCKNQRLALNRRCLVQNSTVSPCQIAVRLGQTAPLILSFPVYVREERQKLRIDRTFSYVEVTAYVSDSCAWMKSPYSIFPIHLRHMGPVNRNIPYLDLRTCPVIDFTKTNLYWISRHISSSFSAQEQGLWEPDRLSRFTGEQILFDFKKTFLCLILTLCRGLGETQGLTLCSFYNSAQGNPQTAPEGDPSLFILASSLCLDRSNRVMVLDCALIPSSTFSALKNILRRLPRINLFADDAQLQL